MLVTKGRQKRSKALYAVLTLTLSIVTMLAMTMTSFAVSEEQAMKNLTNFVQSKMSEKDYTLDGGGSIKGKDLFEGSQTEGYDLNEDAFTSLSSKAQSEVVSDIAMYSNTAVEDDSGVKGVEDSTVQSWWKQLQTKQGVGSKFMTEILKNTKPDFVAANAIWEPFAGPIGIAMGVGAVAIMSLIGLVMVLDIMYITIPPLRIGSDGNDRGLKKSRIFSFAAIDAVRQEEESGNGDSKSALLTYFKKRVFALLVLGLCLLYLISGNIYTLVGYFLDLVSGFLGF